MTTASAAISGPLAASTLDKLPRELVKLALAVMLGAIMVALDMTVVNVALDTLAREFHAPVATIQWVSTGYLLALAMVIPVAGWAIERFAARRVWLTALVLFTAGSVLSGLAWSAGSLIAFRVVQGLGGGMIMPLAQTLLTQAAGPQRLGRVMAVVGVPAMLGPVLGPVLGGLIVSDTSWRLIFYLNVPLSAAAIVAAQRVVMPDTQRPGTRLDVRGLALLSPALAAIVYGLSQAGRHGGFGDAHVFAPVAIGAVLLVGFLVYALKTRLEPIIDVRLFGRRSFASLAGVAFFFSMAMLGTALLLPLYYQQVRGEDALHAGLLLAPAGVGMGIGLAVASRLTDRMNARPIVLAGLVPTAAAMLVYTQMTAQTSVLLLSAAGVISGLGIGAALVAAMAGVFQGLEKEAVARASSAVRILQQLGGSFGIAILAVVLQEQAAHRVSQAGLATAFAHTYWWALAFTVAAFVPTLLVPARRRRRAIAAAAPRPEVS